METNLKSFKLYWPTLSNNEVHPRGHINKLYGVAKSITDRPSYAAPLLCIVGTSLMLLNHTSKGTVSTSSVWHYKQVAAYESYPVITTLVFNT